MNLLVGPCRRDFRMRHTNGTPDIGVVAFNVGFLFQGAVILIWRRAW